MWELRGNCPAADKPDEEEEEEEAEAANANKIFGKHLASSFFKVKRCIFTANR